MHQPDKHQFFKPALYMALALLMLQPVVRAAPPSGVLMAPELEARAIYYRSQNKTLINSEGLQEKEGAGGLQLSGDALSPHRALTFSFWWKLNSTPGKDGGFGLFALTGKGWISDFARSGPWCGLTRPAAVLQVYNFSGIRNINLIYDYDIVAHALQKTGELHHTAIVISGGMQVIVYRDGAIVCDCRLTGRSFSEADLMHNLTLGGDGVTLQEIFILRGAIGTRELEEYVRGTRQLRTAWGMK